MPNLLDPARLLVTDIGARIGANVLFLPETGSTQDVGRDLIARGASAGTVIVAERQTAGRGTHGRPWLGEPGAGLHLSVLVPVPTSANAVPWLTPAAAVATVQALRGLTTVPPRLKWPNDVLLGERKVAGVLTEIPGNSLMAVVGIGINVEATPVGELRYPATCVAEWALRPISREEVAVRLFHELEHLLPVLERRYDQVKEAWRLLVDPGGRWVQVEVDGKVIAGEARAVDGQGALILRTADGSRVRLDAGSGAIIQPGATREETEG